MTGPPALVFEINANLATANDGNYHGLVFSVRGIYDRLTLTLPWNFRFRVDRFYCGECNPVNNYVIGTLSIIVQILKIMMSVQAQQHQQQQHSHQQQHQQHQQQ